MKKIAIYIKNKKLCDDPRLHGLEVSLSEAGFALYRVESKEDVASDTDLMISVGGDGTFLSAAKRVADSGLPLLGVNLGRLGFLSENKPEDVTKALCDGDYTCDKRSLLELRAEGSSADEISKLWPYALNEVTVHRAGAAMLGVDVTIDGDPLPTYWADGLLVATSSGSTAYSLSVGGPICSPGSRVLIISPIAPHNLNVRPLIVPDTTKITISVQSRDKDVMLTMDNRNLTVNPDVRLSLELAQFSLNRVRLNKSNFIEALTSKLFWGEDVRNGSEQ